MISLRGLNVEVRPYAEAAHAYADYYGIPNYVTSTYRTWEEQATLRDRYLRGDARFPANAPGDSAHNYGLAWDSWVPPAAQDDWDTIRRWIGFEVLSNDRIHAQVPGWRAFVR